MPFVHCRLCVHHKAPGLVIGNMKRRSSSLFVLFNQHTMISGALYMFPRESQGGDDDGKCKVSEDCKGCDLLSGLVVAISFLATA